MATTDLPVADHRRDAAAVATTGVARRPGIHVGECVLGGFLLAVAGLLAAGAAGFPVDKGYAILGPQVVPLAVASFMAVIAIGLCWQAATGGFRALDVSAITPPDRARWQAAAWISIGVLALAALIVPVGFVPAAALLFVCAARGFGSRRPARDLAIGIAVVLPVFWLFTMGLGIALPSTLPSLLNAWI